MCKFKNLKVFPNKERQREINGLRVHCPWNRLSGTSREAGQTSKKKNKEEVLSCEICLWVGELGHLQDHLKTHRLNCKESLPPHSQEKSPLHRNEMTGEYLEGYQQRTRRLDNQPASRSRQRASETTLRGQGSVLPEARGQELDNQPRANEQSATTHESRTRRYQSPNQPGANGVQNMPQGVVNNQVDNSIQSQRSGVILVNSGSPSRGMMQAVMPGTIQPAAVNQGLGQNSGNDNNYYLAYPQAQTHVGYIQQHPYPFTATSATLAPNHTYSNINYADAGMNMHTVDPSGQQYSNATYNSSSRRLQRPQSRWINHELQFSNAHTSTKIRAYSAGSNSQDLGLQSQQSCGASNKRTGLGTSHHDYGKVQTHGSHQCQEYTHSNAHYYPHQMCCYMNPMGAPLITVPASNNLQPPPSPPAAMPQFYRTSGMRADYHMEQDRSPSRHGSYQYYYY